MNVWMMNVLQNRSNIHEDSDLKRYLSFETLLAHYCLLLTLQRVYSDDLMVCIESLIEHHLAARCGLGVTACSLPTFGFLDLVMCLIKN